jgi:hypothetical protein
MEPTRCISSFLMTNLLTWRNSKGFEEHSTTNPSTENKREYYKRIISTEIGVALLAIISSVETVAYSAITCITLIVYPFTNNPYKFFVKHLQSSSFTIIWGLANAIYNPISLNVSSDESLARKKILNSYGISALKLSFILRIFFHSATFLIKFLNITRVFSATIIISYLLINKKTKNVFNQTISLILKNLPKAVSLINTKFDLMILRSDDSAYLNKNTLTKIAKSGIVCVSNSGPTETLGNFALCPKGINVFGQSFKCAEAAFQWKKCQTFGISTSKLNEFFTADGQAAFNLSKSIIADKSAPDSWAKNRHLVFKLNGGIVHQDNDRYQAMLAVLRAKFEQNPEMMDDLKITGEAYLFNPNKSDFHSNDADYFSGEKNTFGKMLMDIRNPDQKVPSKPDGTHFQEVLQKFPYSID